MACHGPQRTNRALSAERNATRNDGIAGTGRPCRLEGKFLRVQGKRRAYKIHLGSGNILMEPNDQYLCIVPKSDVQNAKTAVRLPFEGDTVLSIILSKAAFLAADDTITDATILSQIG